MGIRISDGYDILLIQSYGFITEESGSGSDGTKQRIEKARELIRSGQVDPDCFVLLPQGYSKTSPRQPTADRQESLGENIAFYLMSLPEFQEARIIQKPLSWGTADDIRASLLLAEQLHLPFPMAFHFVTDPVHLRRVRLIWLLTRPRWQSSNRQWFAFFHPADHQMTAKERKLREPLARLKEAARLAPVFLRRLIGK